MARDALGEMGYGRLCDTSARYHLPSDMQQSVKEGASGDDDRLGMYLGTPDGAYAYYLFGLLLCHSNRLNQEFVGLVLPDVKVGCAVQHAAPFPDELAAVALCTGTPYSRTLRTVQHAELDGGSVCYQSHLAAQRIDLANNLSFGDAADSRIT